MSAAPLLQRPLDEVHARAAHEAGDEAVGRAVIDLGRRAELLDLLVLHHRDPVGQGQGLDLVVRDVDHRRRAEALMQPLDLDPKLVAELGVEVGERLVEQEHGGVAHQRAADRDPLALARRRAGPGGGRADASICSIAAALATRWSISAFGVFAMRRPKDRFSRTDMRG